MTIRWNFKLRKQIQNYLINFLFFILMIVETLTGFVLWLVLPHQEQRRGLPEESFIWSRSTWIDLHDWFAVALLVVLVVHIILHWKWIVFMTKKVIKGEL